METGSDNGNDWRPELAAVPGAMPYEPEQPRFDACIRARSHLSVRLPFSMVTALGASFCNGVMKVRTWQRVEHSSAPGANL